MKANRTIALISILFWGGSMGAPAQDSAGGPVTYRPGVLEVQRNRSGMFWEHFNDDELLDLLISDDRSFRIYFQQPGGKFQADRSQLIDLHGAGALYDLEQLQAGGAIELITLDENGAAVYAYDPDARQLVRRARPLIDAGRGVSIQHLAPAEFMIDIDGDGDLDLLYPMDGKYYLYFQQDGVFAKENQITTRPVAVRMTTGRDLLRDRIEATVTIPRLNFVDLNGDGRLDLRASHDGRESFYLQTDEGIIPENPSYEVDLNRFKDTSKQTGLLQGGQFQFLPADLNDDGREDYLIVSGNKIRVFMASEEGVDFNRPNHLLKLSTKSMSVLLLPITEDNLPDLVILKYEIPSLGRIVAGLAIGLRFEIDVLGYRNGGDAGFSKRPDFRSAMVFKVPPILKLLGEIESLAEELQSIQRGVAMHSSGDYDGDGLRDALKVQDGKINFYISNAQEARAITESIVELGGHEFLRETLFGQRRRDVTLDTLMTFIRDIAGAFGDALIAGREPSFTLPIGEIDPQRIERIESRDLNDDGVDDLVIFEGPDPKDDSPDADRQRLFLFVSSR